MAILRCKMCGGDLEVTEDMTVAECEYCGTKQTVPTVDDEKKIKLFERANKLRSNCEFDKAAGVYENIVADYSEEAEGYWGLILCRYGIEYVDDPATGKKIPTCHRSSFDSIMDDEDFELVMENSDSASRVVYREEAKYIEEIRKGIIEVSGKEEPYDIFICYKETDENGNRTIDSVLAQDVYDELTNRGHRVFFSRITLEDKLGIEYEPYIFAALNSAKIMLAFGTSYDYYNAVWVKNEWSRFLKLMAKDKTKHLIPCFKDVDAYDIPKEFAKLQAQDMGKIGAIQDLLRGIDKLLASESKVEKTTNTENIVFNSLGANGNAYLKRGFMALEDKEWSKATDFFEQVLNINAEDGQAYWGELLAEQKSSNAGELSVMLHDRLMSNIRVDSLVAEISDRYTEFCQRYFFLEVFDQEEINKLFYKKFKYLSKVSGVEEIIASNNENFILSESKLYQRALQYADEALRAEINKVTQDVDEYLHTSLTQFKTEEEAALQEAVAEADKYFDILDQALQKADTVASANAERNEAVYQADLASWTEERDSLDSRKLEWQRQMKQYEQDYAAWQARCEGPLQEWHEAKKVYAVEKQKLQDMILQLEDDRRLVNGIGAEWKIIKINEKISKLKNQLSDLEISIKQRPQMEPMPTQPVEPVLREMPTLSFEDRVCKEEVRQVFENAWKGMEYYGSEDALYNYIMENYFNSGEKAKAIEYYKEQTGVGLQKAKEIIETMFAGAYKFAVLTENDTESSTGSEQKSDTIVSSKNLD